MITTSGEKQRLTLQEAKDQLIEKHLKKFTEQGLFKSSLDHFSSSGKASGSWRSALHEMMEEYASQSLPIREKPDFDAMADNYAERCNGGSRGSGIIQQSYKAACERIWKDYVEPIR